APDSPNQDEISNFAEAAAAAQLIFDRSDSPVGHWICERDARGAFYAQVLAPCTRAWDRAKFVFAAWASRDFASDCQAVANALCTGEKQTLENFRARFSKSRY